MDNKAQPKKKKWFIPLVLSLLVFSFLAVLVTFTSTSAPPFLRQPVKVLDLAFVESKVGLSPAVSAHPVPRIAYLISGSMGDGLSLRRTLKALYHPWNQYAVHLDLKASPEERMDLVNFVRNESVFSRWGNVRVVVRANLVTYRGPTMVSNTLHAAAILMKEGGYWDWFINLSASDYPLVTQDGIYKETSIFFFSNGALGSLLCLSIYLSVLDLGNQLFFLWGGRDEKNL